MGLFINYSRSCFTNCGQKRWTNIDCFTLSKRNINNKQQCIIVWRNAVLWKSNPYAIKLKRSIKNKVKYEKLVSNRFALRDFEVANLAILAPPKEESTLVFSNDRGDSSVHGRIARMCVRCNKGLRVEKSNRFARTYIRGKTILGRVRQFALFF